jgi:hypothetical protein
MELLETQDPEKKKLIEASDRHRRELEKEVSAITQKTEKVLTNALIIGGALALTYLAVTQLSKPFKKKKARKKKMSEAAQTAVAHEAEPEEEDDSEGPSLLAQIGTKVVNQATLVLLDIARQRLTQYLQTRKTEDEPS